MSREVTHVRPVRARTSWLFQAMLVARKDLKLELSTGEVVTTSGFFAALHTSHGSWSTSAFLGNGPFRGASFFVDDGLAKGEIVVTAGVNRLREGQKVRLGEGGQP